MLRRFDLAVLVLVVEPAGRIDTSHSRHQCVPGTVAAIEPRFVGMPRREVFAVLRLANHVQTCAISSPTRCLFSDAGPDIRWSATSAGHRGRDCWATADSEGLRAGACRRNGAAQSRRRPGSTGCPRCDVSIRPGGSTTSTRTAKVKNRRSQLVDLYIRRWDGRFALCSISPPSRRGRFTKTTLRSLREFRETY